MKCYLLFVMVELVLMILFLICRWICKEEKLSNIVLLMFCFILYLNRVFDLNLEFVWINMVIVMWSILGILFLFVRRIMLFLELFLKIRLKLLLSIVKIRCN